MILTELWSDAVYQFMLMLQGGARPGGTTCCPPHGPIRCVDRDLPLLKLRGHLADPQSHSDRCQLTDNLLVLAEVQWAERNRIKSFSLQAFVTKGITLDGLAKLSAQDCIDAWRSVHSLEPHGCPKTSHYRCESHEHALGAPFWEPFVHIHRELKGEPRLPLSLQPQDNPITAFLEFLAINNPDDTVYDGWRAWARDVCGRSGLRDAWDAVEEVYACFGGGQRLDAILAKHANSLHTVRETLRTARNLPFPWTMSRANHPLLSYWG